MTILKEARKLVYGARGASYGHPLDDFTRTGKMWGAILGCPPVPAEKVALCMMALKMSRECHLPGRDNRVDMAGYAETLDMVVREREVRDGAAKIARNLCSREKDGPKECRLPGVQAPGGCQIPAP